MNKLILKEKDFNEKYEILISESNFNKSLKIVNKKLTLVTPKYSIIEVYLYEKDYDILEKYNIVLEKDLTEDELYNEILNYILANLNISIKD